MTNTTTHQWHKDPDGDGITHIWISPNGKTELGRMLYIGSYRPFHHPRDGYFASIFAYWVWLGSSRKEDSIRDLHHDNSIRSSLAGMQDTQVSRTKICEALNYSIEQNELIRNLLYQSKLPFAIYEVIEYDPNQKPIAFELPGRDWYVNEIENIRHRLQTQG